MLMSLFIGAMVINENLNKYNIEELIQKMVQTKVMGDFEFIEQQFKKYENRELNLKVGENSFSIPFEDDLKLVFCRLDLALHDINY